MTTQRERDLIASYNERAKLTATALNNMGVGTLLFAFIQPSIAGTFAVTWPSGLAVIAGLALHALARYIVGTVVKEKK